MYLVFVIFVVERVLSLVVDIMNFEFSSWSHVWVLPMLREVDVSISIDRVVSNTSFGEIK